MEARWAPAAAGSAKARHPTAATETVEMAESDVMVETGAAIGTDAPGGETAVAGDEAAVAT